MEFYLILIAFVAIYFASIYYKRRNLPPGPLGYPILGYLPHLNSPAPYKILAKLTDKYGPIYGLYLGSIYAVVVSDVNLVRQLLKREELTGRAPLYLTHGIMKGCGIVCSEGLLWKDHRRQLIEWMRKLGMHKQSPGSARNVFENILRKNITEFLKMIRESPNYRTGLDLSDILFHTIGNLLNEIVFGEVYEHNDPRWIYLRDLQQQGVKKMGVVGLVNFIPTVRFLPSNKKAIDFIVGGLNETHKIYQKIIDKNVEIIKSRSDDDSEGGNEENKSVLQYFICEKNKRTAANDSTVELYNDMQLRYFLADLFGAGVDTTLATLKWLLLYLAKNVSIQKTLRKEILLACQSNEFSFEELERIDYLKACVSEAQRIRSVVPTGLPHGAKEDILFENYKIPKGCMLMPLLWGIHMNPKNFPDPEKFDPQRFLNDDGRYTTPNNFIPFQTGKRICVGEDMAKMILFEYTAAVLYNFDVSLPENHEVNMEGVCGITLDVEYELIFKEIENESN